MNENKLWKLAIPETIYAAFLVMMGEYGTGENRKSELVKDGYNPERVQECVNDMVKMRDKYAD